MAKSAKITSKASMGSIPSMTSVTASIAVMLTDLMRNLLGNCLGDLYRNLGTVFLGNWMTLFFRNLHWNLDGNFAAGLVGNLNYWTN